MSTTSSGSRDSEKLVKPRMSENSTVMRARLPPRATSESRSTARRVSPETNLESASRCLSPADMSLMLEASRPISSPVPTSTARSSWPRPMASAARPMTCTGRSTVMRNPKYRISSTTSTVPVL